MQNAAMSVHGRVKFSKLISSTPPGECVVDDMSCTDVYIFTEKPTYSTHENLLQI